MEFLLLAEAPQDAIKRDAFLCLRRPAMTDTMPDRLSTDPKSPHYDAALLERGVGIRFNGAEKTNCEEYCVSEGWVRLAVGKTMDRFGKPMTVKLKGKVEPYLREPEDDTAG
jgi:hypothetical protein